jgi:acetate kinase
MGFTALDGLPMGTRPGQIDPGVLLYLIEHKKMSAAAVQDFLYRGCGLKGLSGISNDVRELQSSTDPRAALRISPTESRVALYVIPTNEELMIARHTLAALSAKSIQ